MPLRLLGTAILAIALNALLQLQPVSAGAGEVRLFASGDQVIAAEEITAETSVLFRAMRFNEATEQWNVELVVTNRGERSFTQPLFLLVESFSNTTGPLVTDGATVEAAPRRFLALNFYGVLAPGGVSPSRTLALGFIEDAGAPRLRLRVFGVPSGPAHALALTRTLDGTGQPLTNVRVTESGPQGNRVLTTDPDYGVITLGQAPGEHSWKFEREGYLPVWRQQSLLRGAVRLLPNPRLVRRGTHTLAIQTGGAPSLQDPAGNVRLQFAALPPDAGSPVTLTLVDGQTLPGHLPAGWSPLRAFWVEFTNTSLSATLALRPEGAIAPTETATLARWNADALHWEALVNRSGNGTNEIEDFLQGPGAYALVVPDSGALAPPAAVEGQPLPASAAQPVLTLTAQGTVAPAVSAPSRVAEQVTATATVRVTNSTGSLPSGLILRAEVTELYRLQDSSTRFTAFYETFVSAYRRPAATGPSALECAFPMRPLLLFGADDLAEASVDVAVLSPDIFRGAVFDSSGGLLVMDRVRLGAGAGDFATPQAALLRPLSSTNLPALLSPGQSIAAAFDLTVTGVETGRSLSLQISNLAPNRHFILARILSGASFNGLEPVARLRSGTNGLLSSLEPAAGERLSGLRGAGQFLVVEVSGAHGLIRGTARNAQNQPAPNLPVRVTDQPWLTFSSSNGAYLLVAPTGTVQVAVTDFASGDTDFVDSTVIDSGIPLTLDLGTRSRGPRVANVTPPANARGVSRVTPIVVTFTEPVNPGTLVSGGLQLLGSNAVPVTASLSLNHRGTVATLLPVTPLDPDAAYTVRLSTNITDLTGLSLEGPAAFAFTTETDRLSRRGGELVIYEPGATNIPANIRARLVGFQPGRDPAAVVVHGTAGAAEPGQPVILVNETSGETSTTLSEPDGSFYGVIRGDESDLVSATLVNANGTRTFLPVSRQRFGNGFTGLFKQGGILAEESDGGGTQVIVEPGSIEHRTKIRFETLDLQRLLDALNNTQPVEGRVLGGVEYEEEGEGLKAAADIQFPVAESALGLAPGEDPAQAGFALTIPRMFGDTVVYEIIDTMQFERTAPGQGRLVTRSPPFVGLLLRKIKEAERNTQVHDGLSRVRIGEAGSGEGQSANPRNVLAFIATKLLGQTVVEGQVREADVNAAGLPTSAPVPVPGAVVAVDAADAVRTPGTFRSGEVVAVTGTDGKFAMGFSTSVFSGRSRMVFASHPRFSRRLAGPVALPSGASGTQVFVAELLFGRPVASGGSVGGKAAPLVSIGHQPAFGTPGSADQDGTVLRVAASDDTQANDPSVTVEKVLELLGPNELNPDLVTVSPGDTRRSSPRQVLKEFRLQSSRSCRAFLTVEARDGDGNSVTVPYLIPFGDTPRGSNAAPLVVLRSWPPAGSTRVPLTSPVQLFFNKPIEASALTEDPPTWLTIDSDHVITSIQGSENNRLVSVAIRPAPGASPGVPVTLTAGVQLSGEDGSSLDQNSAADGAQSFTLSFQPAETHEAPLAGMTDGSGVVFQGAFAYALERTPAGGGRLHAFELTDEAEMDEIASVDLIGRPSDLSLIADYPLILEADGPCVSGDFLAVISGAVTDPKSLTLIPVIPSGDSVEFGERIRGVLSISPASMVVKSKWDPPFFGYLETGADVTSVALLDLNAFAIGNTADRDVIATFPDVQQEGEDANFDGDYCDPGDVPPMPGRIRSGPFGLSFSFAPLDPAERIVDFDFDADFALLGTVFNNTSNQLGGFRMVLGGDTLLTLDDDAMVNFPSGQRPKRVLLLPRAQVLDGDAQVIRDLAIVSMAAIGGGDGLLRVVDISNPESPVLLPNAIPLPSGEGSANTIQRRPDGLLILATSRNSLLLDPRFLLRPAGAAGHPAIIGVIDAVGGGVRNFVADLSGVNIVNAGAEARLRLTGPHCEIVTLGGSLPVLPAEGIAMLTPAEIRARLADDRPISIAQVASLDATNLPPVDRNLHYYVLIRAPGAAGPTLDVAAASLDARGNPLVMARKHSVPTILADPGVVTLYQAMAIVHWAKDWVRTAQLALAAEAGGLPAVARVAEIILSDPAPLFRQIDSTVRWINHWQSYPTVLVGYRLGNEQSKSTELYNTYLAGPFVLLSRELEPERLNDLQEQLPRAYLRAGQGLWAGPGLGRAQDISSLSRLLPGPLNIANIPGLPGELQPTPTPIPPTFITDDQRQNPVIGRFCAEMGSATGILPANISLADAVADAGIIAGLLEGSFDLDKLGTALEIGGRYLDADFQPMLTPGASVLKPVAFQVRPLVFVPGVMASKLADSSGDHYWIFGQFDNTAPDFDEKPLDMDRAGNPATELFPSDVTRRVLVQPIYSPLLDSLTGDLGMVEYDFISGLEDRPQDWAKRRKLKEAGGEPNLGQQPLPNLYVFAYDWRRDNAFAAQELKQYVDLVLKMHPEAGQVDILAHSMGGLVSRRFILENPDLVRRFITVGTPWLGATKAVNAMKNGDFDEVMMNVIAPPRMLRRISMYMPGVHQLLPARGLFDLGLNPLYEAGWDLNTNGVAYETYSYADYRAAMEQRLFEPDLKELLDDTQPSPSMNNHENLHFSFGGKLADWRDDDLPIEYYHLFGLKSVPSTAGRAALTLRLTPVSGASNNVVLNAPPMPYRDSEDNTGEDRPPPGTLTGQLPLGPQQYRLTPSLEITRVMGDGTVPALSLHRGHGSDSDLNHPNARLYPVVTTDTDSDDDADHNGELDNPRLLEIVRRILEDRPPEQVVVALGGANSGDEGQPLSFNASVTPTAEVQGQPKFVWDFGDGAGDLTSGGSTSHVYLNDGAYVVTCAVTFENGVAGVSSQTVFVRNKPPTVEIENGNIEIPAGATPLLVAKVTDPGVLDQHTFEWDFNDDGVVDFRGSFVAVPEFNQSGIVTVRVTVRDNLGEEATDTINVTVGQGQSPVMPPFVPADLAVASGSQQKVEVRVAGFAFESSLGFRAIDAGVSIFHPLDAASLGLGNLKGNVLQAAANLRADRASQEMSVLRSFRKTGPAGPINSSFLLELGGANQFVEIEALYSAGGVSLGRHVWEVFLPKDDDVFLPGTFLPNFPTAATLEFEFPETPASELGNVKFKLGNGTEVQPRVVQIGDAALDRNGPSVALVRNPRTGRVFIIGRDDFSSEAKLEYFLGEDRNNDGRFENETFYRLTERSFKEEALPSRHVAVIARDEAGNFSRPDFLRLRTSSDVDFKHSAQGVAPPPVFEEDFCDVITRIQGAARGAIAEAVQDSMVRLFLLDAAHLWVFEQGSGACLWKKDPCETCRPAFDPGSSDHDYELFLPVHVENPVTDRLAFLASDPYSAANLEGDWYFKPPEGLNGSGLPIDALLPDGSVNPGVASWRYTLPSVRTNVVTRPASAANPANPFFQRLTPAEVIAYFFTQTALKPVCRTNLNEVSFFPFRREHFQFAVASMEKPPPFGDDPVGDAGMGRHLLLLKWVLEGAYVSGVPGVNANTASLATVFQHLALRGVPAADGYEWGVFQDYAALRAGARLRAERTDLPADKPRSAVHDDFARQDRKIVRKVGKAAIRATLARIAGDPTEAGLVLSTTPQQYSAAQYPTFENFIADLATNRASSLFPGPQRQLISQFIAAKMGDRAFIDALLDEGRVGQFIEDAFAFMRGAVQPATKATYEAYLAGLASGNVNGIGFNEHSQRTANMLELDFGAPGFGQPGASDPDETNPGRRRYLGLDGGVRQKFAFNFRAQNLGTNEAIGVTIRVGPAGGGGGAGPAAGLRQFFAAGNDPNVFDEATQENIGVLSANGASTILSGNPEPLLDQGPVGELPSDADPGVTKSFEAEVTAEVRGEPNDPPDTDNRIRGTARMLPNAVVTPPPNLLTLLLNVVPESGDEFLLEDHPGSGNRPRSPRYLLRRTDEIQVIALARPGLGPLPATITTPTDPVGIGITLTPTGADSQYYQGSFRIGATGTAADVVGLIDEELLRVSVQGPGNTGAIAADVLVDRAEIATGGLTFANRASGPQPRLAVHQDFTNRHGFFAAGDVQFQDDVGQVQGPGGNPASVFIGDFGANQPETRQADVLYFLAHGFPDGTLHNHNSSLGGGSFFDPNLLVPTGPLWNRDAELLLLHACFTLNELSDFSAEPAFIQQALTKRSLNVSSIAPGRFAWERVMSNLARPVRAILGFHQLASQSIGPAFAQFTARAETDPAVVSWQLAHALQPWAVLYFENNARFNLRELPIRPLPNDVLRFEKSPPSAIDPPDDDEVFPGDPSSAHPASGHPKSSPPPRLPPAVTFTAGLPGTGASWHPVGHSESPRWSRRLAPGEAPSEVTPQAGAQRATALVSTATGADVAWRLVAADTIERTRMQQQRVLSRESVGCQVVFEQTFLGLAIHNASAVGLFYPAEDSWLDVRWFNPAPTAAASADAEPALPESAARGVAATRLPDVGTRARLQWVPVAATSPAGAIRFQPVWTFEKRVADALSGPRNTPVHVHATRGEIVEVIE